MVIKPIAYSCYMIYKITIIILLCYTISFTIIGHCGKPWAIPNRRRHRSSAAFQANRREPVSEVIPQRKFDPKLWENEEFLSGSQPFLDVRQKRRNWAWAIAIFLKETSAESERRQLGFVVEHRMISFARDFFGGRLPWRSMAGGSWYYQILTWSMINDDVPRCHHLCQSLYIYIYIHIHKPWYPTNIQFMSMYVLMI